MTKDTFEENERDTEALAYSLMGVLLRDSEEGLRAKDRAHAVSKETSTFLERRSWLYLPRMTL
jgi:hypothetical protein